MVSEGLIFEVEITEMIGTVVALDNSFITKQIHKTQIHIDIREIPASSHCLNIAV